MGISREDALSLGWLLCLFAFIPVVRGGHLDWVSILFSTGIGWIFCMRLAMQCHRGRLEWVCSRSDFWIGATLVAAGVSLSRPGSPPDAFISLLFIVSFAGCFFLVRSLSRDVSLLLHLITGLLVIAGLLSLGGIFQLLDLLPHSWWKPSRFLASTFVNHNHFAAYLEVLLPVGVALCWKAPLGPRQKFVAAISSVLIFLGLILSCSRGAWLSLLLALSGLVGWLGFRVKTFQWNWKGIILGVMLLGIFLFLATRPPVWLRVMSLFQASEDLSIQARLMMWKGAWPWVWKHPVAGFGLQSFYYLFPNMRPEGLFFFMSYAHNEYLQTLVELGFLGFFPALMCAVFFLYRPARLAAESQTPWKRALGLGAVTGLVSFLLHSFVDFPWHIPAAAYQFAAVAGLAAGIPHHTDRSSCVLQTPFFPERKTPRVFFMVLILVVGMVFVPPAFSFIHADFLAARGEKALKADHFERAASHFESAAGKMPFRVRYWRLLADSRLEMGLRGQGSDKVLHLRKAEEAYRRALDLMPGDAQSIYNLSRALKAIGNLTESRLWVLQAVQQDPHNPLYWKSLGDCERLMGHPKEAVAAYREAVRFSQPYGFFPKVFSPLVQPEFFAQLGDRERRTGNWSSARTDYQIAMELDPNHEGARLGLAVAELNQGRLAADQDSMPALEGAVNQSIWLSEKARVASKEGKWIEVRTLVESSLKLDAENLLALQLKFLAARELKDSSEHGKTSNSILALNKAPVHEKPDRSRRVLVWEPEESIYPKGEKVSQGWALYGNGAIRQNLFLPPGKIRFEMRAKGSKAKTKGPVVRVSWNDRMIWEGEIQSEAWSVYHFEAASRLGECLLEIAFVNDHKDSVTREDRNFKLDKVTVFWEGLS